MLLNARRRTELLMFSTPISTSTALSVTEGIEALKGVANERQAEVRIVGLACSLCRSAHLRRCVDLGDLVNREVLSIDGTGELGLERSANLAQTIPIDAAEEVVFLQLGSTTHVAKTVLGVADEATISLVIVRNKMSCTLTL
jgi:hypothetical protein